MLRRTVVVVDMVGYSSVARMLEQNISALSVADLNFQIQSLISRSLLEISDANRYCVIARTGDGIILLFERPDDAHDFSSRLHLLAKEHNNKRSEITAERWFRIGIATGDVIASCEANEAEQFAGTTIANAVRLEAAARAGQIVMEAGTYDTLSGHYQRSYGAEETVTGKRTEQFRVRRFEVTPFPTICAEQSTAPKDLEGSFPSVRSLANLSRSRGMWAWTLVLLSFVVLTSAGVMHLPAMRERVPTILFASPVKHLAFLPLQVTPDNAESQAVADGLMDSLAGRLSNLDSKGQALWVVPSSDIRDHKVVDPTSAKRVFGATVVTRGSFSRGPTGSRLRLAVIDSGSGRQMGFIDIETQAGDLTDLQDDAITRLARLLDLSGVEELVKVTSTSPTRAAYEDYLEGVGYLERQDRPGYIKLGIAAFERAVRKDPQFALGFARVSQAYLTQYELTSDQQWLARAKESAWRAAQLSDQISSTYVALAQLHELLGDQSLAIQEYQRALRLEPTNAGALEGWADALRKQGRSEEALSVYKKRTTQRPDDWAGYNSIGNFFLDINKPKEAMTEFERGLVLAPDNSWLLIGLSASYTKLDDAEMLRKAEAALRKSIAINPTFVAYNNLALLYLKLHHFEDSASASQEALRLNDRNGEVWANLAEAYEWLHQEEKGSFARAKAAQLFETAIKLNFQNVTAHSNLAEIYAKEGETASSKSEISISLALAPKNGYVLLDVADAYELIGERQLALKFLAQALGYGLPKSELQSDPHIQTVLSAKKPS